MNERTFDPNHPPREPFDVRCADALADEVSVLVMRQVLDARSPAADALIDYRNPPSTPRADRLAELEAEMAAWQRVSGQPDADALSFYLARETLPESVDRDGRILGELLISRRRLAEAVLAGSPEALTLAAEILK